MRMRGTHLPTEIIEKSKEELKNATPEKRRAIQYMLLFILEKTA